MSVSAVKQPKPVRRILAENWFILFLVIAGVYVWTPFLAPIFMETGFTAGGRAIQAIYSTQCHQLPDRSFFLFGPKLMYTQSEIQAAWKNTTDPTVLRQFIGNAAMGWKVAWSDRMVSMYTSTWLFALLWWPFRRQIKPLPLWGLVLFWSVMGIDGGTHFISDLLGGMDAGFRYSNNWLAVLTNHALPQWFYAGNALGSFNSWMRILSGVFFGLGLVWFAMPIVAQTVQQELRRSNMMLDAKTRLAALSANQRSTQVDTDGNR